MRTHQEIDRRSLELHRAVAEKIRKEPTLLRIAQDNLDRWERRGASHSQPYLEEWRRILNSGTEVVLLTIVDPSARATALRQSSPFSGVLTPRERSRILAAWSQTT